MLRMLTRNASPTYVLGDYGSHPNKLYMVIIAIDLYIYISHIKIYSCYHSAP